MSSQARPKVRAIAVALVLAAGVGGCGSAARHPATARAPARQAQTAAARVDGCVTLGGRTRAVVLHPAGAPSLPAVLIGRGPVTFVLSDESDENLCSWLPFVAALRERAYAALLYDYADPAALAADAVAGVRAARAAGARAVVLMGASVGARGSIEAAATHPAGLAAVVSLSAEQRVSTDQTDLLGPARRVSAPVLLVSARDDPFVAGFTPALLRALGSRDKHAIVVTGADHGTDLLSGAEGPGVRDAILALAARLR